MSEDQFNTAYREYAALVHHSIMRVVNNRAIADDLMQETFLRFLQKADPDRPSAYKSFLFQISHNLAMDYLKKFSRVSNFEVIPERPDRRDQIGDAEFGMLRSEMVSKMLAHDPSYLKIFVLRVDYDMTYDEIATTLKIPKRSLMRYKDQLRNILAEFL